MSGTDQPVKKYKCPECGAVGYKSGEEDWRQYKGNYEPVVFHQPGAQSVSSGEKLKPHNSQRYWKCSKCGNLFPINGLPEVNSDEPVTLHKTKDE